MSIEKNRFKQKNDSQPQHNYGRPTQVTPRATPVFVADIQSNPPSQAAVNTTEDYADWREVAAKQMSSSMPAQSVIPPTKQEQLKVVVPKVSPDAPKPIYEQAKLTMAPNKVSMDPTNTLTQTPINDGPKTGLVRGNLRTIGKQINDFREQLQGKFTAIYGHLGQANNRYKVGAASLLLIIFIGIVGHSLLQGESPLKGSQAAIGNITVKKDPASANKLSNATVAGADAQPRPGFDLLAPADKPQLADPTKAGHSYDQVKNVYSYTDLVVGVPITVSQQPLPSGEGSAQSKIDDIATKLGAAQQIPTNSGIAYLQIDTKNNVHVVVFTKKDVLVLIRGTYPLPANVWAEYINSLQ